MDKYECLRKLMTSFPNSSLLSTGEFIAYKDANAYFTFDGCETEIDVKCKVLEWLSRDAFKSTPFYIDAENEKLHEFILNGINNFLDTDFTEKDIAVIYQYLGNYANHYKTIDFIKSGYDFSVLYNKE